MNIPLHSIKEISDCGEFTTIVLNSGNSVHTPLTKDTHTSIVIGEMITTNGNTEACIRIDFEFITIGQN